MKLVNLVMDMGFRVVGSDEMGLLGSFVDFTF